MKKLHVAAVSAFALVVLAGAGCQAVNTAADAAEAKAAGQEYAMSEVEAANSREKCWTAIDGGVYDLTKWIDVHPGGPGRILSLCGTDGTQAYQARHGSQARPGRILTSFKVGVLKP